MNIKIEESEKQAEEFGEYLSNFTDKEGFKALAAKLQGLNITRSTLEATCHQCEHGVEEGPLIQHEIWSIKDQYAPHKVVLFHDKCWESYNEAAYEAAWNL